MPEQNNDDIKNLVAEVDITIEWNQIAIGSVKTIIYEGDEVTICSEDYDARYLIAEGNFEGAHYKIQSCQNGVEGAKKALKEEIESCLKRTW